MMLSRLKQSLRTPLDVPIFIFLLSGFIGFWASYDPAASLPKLLMLIGAVVVYYSIVLARGMPRLFSFVAWMYLLGGAGAALYFIAQTDFAFAPRKFEILTQLGMGLNAFLPRLLFSSPHPNIAAGVLEFVLPFAVFATIHWLKLRGWTAGVAAGICTVVILLGLLLTASRGAWAASAVVATVSALGYLTFVLLRTLPMPRRQRLFRAAIGFAIAGSLLLSFIFIRPLTPLWNGLDANQTAASRLELYQQTWELIQEYPFTGAGLGVFPLVYAAYVMLIDAPLLPHAHNIFLAVWIEQGILGIGALVWLLTAFAVWGWRTRRTLTWISAASFAAVAIWLVHGLVDIPMYGSHALPLLFAPFALAIAATIPGARVLKGRTASEDLSRQTNRVPIVIMLLVTGLVTAVSGRFIVSAFCANLGAVAQTKAELSLYRIDKPPIAIRSIMEIRRTLTTPLSAAERWYQIALKFNPNNSAAHRRLGLIALARRDLKQAVSQLGAAWQEQPNSRATKKGLGYAFAWSGEPEQASALLKPFPETRIEIRDDTWWWRFQGRPDLADDAQKLFSLLSTPKAGSCSARCR